MPHIHLNQSQMNALLQVSATVSGTSKTISGAVALGGLVEITATAHGFTSGAYLLQSGIVGTTEANGIYGPIVVVDVNHYTIPVTFVNAYTSGGTAAAVTFATGLTSSLFKRDLTNLKDSADRVPDSSTLTLTNLIQNAP